MRLLEYDRSLVRGCYLPLIGRYFKDSQCTSGAKPALAHFLQVPETMNKISLSGLFRHVEQVNSTSCVCDINRNVANLLEAVGAFVNSEQLGNSGGGLGA